MKRDKEFLLGDIDDRYCRKEINREEREWMRGILDLAEADHEVAGAHRIMKDYRRYGK